MTPEIVQQAIFESSYQYSEGIEHVIVAGTLVVRDNELVPGVYPGKAIRAAN